MARKGKASKIPKFKDILDTLKVIDGSKITQYPNNKVVDKLEKDWIRFVQDRLLQEASNSEGPPKGPRRRSSI